MYLWNTVMEYNTILGDFSQLQRNMPQQLSRMMDPKMLQQMGGASGLQNLMKQFSSQFRE